MATTITLPDTLETELQQRARVQQRSVEDIALEILHEAFAETTLPGLDAVVAKIKSTGPNQHNIRSAQGSLADVLRRTHSTQDFDLDQWNKEWAAVEAEMRAVEQADDIAEGRG
jgi:plasmid stability protein